MYCISIGSQRTRNTAHSNPGWTIPRNSVSIRLGNDRNRPLHWPLRSRRSMVCLHSIPFPQTIRSLQPLQPMLTTPLFTQGYLHNRFLHPRRRRQSSPHPHQKPHLHHLLRSGRHLRRHHGHRLFRKTVARARRAIALETELLYGVRTVLVGGDGGDVQFDLWCQRGDQWE